MSWWTRTPPPEGDRPPHVSWRLFVLLFGASTVLRFAYFYLDDLTRQLPGTFVPRLIEEGTGNFASALLFPIALLAERYFPVDGGRWRRNAFVHVLGYIAYSTAHTTVIALTRPPIFAAAGLGHYDYGLMSVRYFMESAQDAFSYATFLGILTLMRVNARLRERDVRAAQLERDAVSARLESLSLRLQPHFLFNALNTISSTVYEDPVAADELIGRLGELLRESLRTTDRQEIPLGEELEVLRAYLSFVDARFGDRVKWTIDAGAEERDLAVPAFILQPLVENAVRHGAAFEYGNMDILISARRDRDAVRLVVDNTMAERSDEPARVGTGLGTTRDRLALLYGPAASLDVAAAGGRFRVTVTIPARVGPPAPIAPSESDRAGAHR